jgi:hypothetical protein
MYTFKLPLHTLLLLSFPFSSFLHTTTTTNFLYCCIQHTSYYIYYVPVLQQNDFFFRLKKNQIEHYRAQRSLFIYASFHDIIVPSTCPTVSRTASPAAVVDQAACTGPWECARSDTNSVPAAQSAVLQTEYLN